MKGNIEYSPLQSTEISSDSTSVQSLPKLANKEFASTFTTVILMMKGMIGLAVLMLPQTMKYMGYFGFTVTYLGSTLCLVYLISLVTFVSIKIGYQGNR